MQAWTTCNVLLMSPDVPEACKTFAAQTFRAKVSISLEKLDMRHNYEDLRALSAPVQLSILLLLAAEGPLHTCGDRPFSRSVGSGTIFKVQI